MFVVETYMVNFNAFDFLHDRLCGLVVGVSGYRSRGPGFNSRSVGIVRLRTTSHGAFFFDFIPYLGCIGKTMFVCKRKRIQFPKHGAFLMKPTRTMRF
jgi:hypothetical protein